MRFSRSRSILVALAVLLALAASLPARQAAPARQAVSFTVVTAESRRPLAATVAGDQAMVALDDLAALFQVSVREVSGTVSVTYKNKSILLTPGQSVVSAGGRLVSLPAPLRDEPVEGSQGRTPARRWVVPVEFLSRALSAIYDSRIEVRKPSRLVLVGDVRVPRVVVTADNIGNQLRVTMELTPRTGHGVTHDGNRLLVKFDADWLDVSLPAVPAQGLLQGLHVEPASTVVLDLGPRFGSYRAAVSPLEGNASQLVLDLFGVSSEPVPMPGQTKPLVPPTDEPVPGVPVGLRTIVIDPGHGGDEAGAKGSSGAVEKDITLTIARRLRAALEGRLGLRVLLTRDGDTGVPLDERAALANTNKADLLLSLHANASLRPDVSGAQVFYLSADETGEEARRAAATRQTLPTLGGGTRDIEMILWEMAQLSHLNESAALAAAIEGQFRGRVRLNARAVQQAPFRVLAGANMPAVLVEIGFLTNPDEEQQLSSETYQATIVQALLDAVLQFRDAKDRGTVPQVPAPLPPAAPASPKGPGGPSR